MHQYGVYKCVSTLVRHLQCSAASVLMSLLYSYVLQQENVSFEAAAATAATAAQGRTPPDPPPPPKPSPQRHSVLKTLKKLLP